MTLALILKVIHGIKMWPWPWFLNNGIVRNLLKVQSSCHGSKQFHCQWQLSQILPSLKNGKTTKFHFPKLANISLHVLYSASTIMQIIKSLTGNIFHSLLCLHFLLGLSVEVRPINIFLLHMFEAKTLIWVHIDTRGIYSKSVLLTL